MSYGRGVLILATVAGLSLLARSLFIGPVPLWLASCSLIAYVALILAGVLVPQLEMFADILWHGPRDRPQVVLTFDDGPHPMHTRRVLDDLERAGVTATFFVLGDRVKACPDCLREILDRGHTVGLHGLTHDRLLSLRRPSHIEQQLRQASSLVEQLTDATPYLFRPPIGHVSPRTETASRKLGLTIVAWSARGMDGLSKTPPATVAARIRKKLRPGALILLHDAAESGDRVPAGVEALPTILDDIAAKGLEVVPLSAWLE